MVSNDLLLSMRSLHLSQCVLLKLAIREIISSIKLTESMVLAVDEILHLHAGLCGTMLWSCLLNTGALFTWRQFLHLAQRRCVHHCTQVAVIFQGLMEPLRLQWVGLWKSLRTRFVPNVVTFASSITVPVAAAVPSVFVEPPFWTLYRLPIYC